VNEGIKRKLSTDKAARQFRKALADVRWVCYHAIALYTQCTCITVLYVTMYMYIMLWLMSDECAITLHIHVLQYCRMDCD